MKKVGCLVRIGCMLLLCNLTVDSVVGEILPITEQVKKETELRGRVTDAATGEVIIGASVMLEGQRLVPSLIWMETILSLIQEEDIPLLLPI